MAWMDILISCPDDDKRRAWVTACLSKQLCYRQKKVSSVLQKNKQPSPAHRIFLFTLEESRCQLKSNHDIGTWYFVSQHMIKDVDLSKKTTNILGHACAWDKYRNLITSPNSKEEKHPSVRLVEPSDKINGQREVRNLLGPSPLGGNPHYFRKSTARSRKCGPFFYIGAFGSQISAEFLLAADSRTRQCERGLPYRARDVRNSHQSWTSSSFHAPSTPWTNKTRTRRRAEETVLPDSPRLRCLFRPLPLLPPAPQLKLYFNA